MSFQRAHVGGNVHGLCELSPRSRSFESKYEGTGKPVIALECPFDGNSGGTAEIFRPEQLLRAFFILKECYNYG